MPPGWRLQFVSVCFLYRGWNHFNGRHMLRKYSCYVTSVIYPMMSHLLDRTRATSFHAISNLSTVRWIKSCLMEHLRHFFFFCKSMWVVISSDVWLTLWVIHEGCHVQNAVGPRCSKKRNKLCTPWKTTRQTINLPVMLSVSEEHLNLSVLRNTAAVE